MRTISIWARDHRWKARIIIIFIIYPLLNLVGWFIGDVLALNGVHINQAWCYPLSFFFLLLFLMYPFRSDKKYKNYFLWKKSIDVLMICASFCFILVRGNGFNADNTQNIFVTGSYATNVSEKTTIEPASKIKKEKKNPIKKLVKNIRHKYKNASKEGKAGLIILAVLGAIVLLFGLGLLTCSIACSGAEGLAYVVFFLGLGGIIFGLVRVIQRITKGPRKKKEPEIKSS